MRAAVYNTGCKFVTEQAKNRLVVVLGRYCFQRFLARSENPSLARYLEQIIRPDPLVVWNVLAKGSCRVRPDVIDPPPRTKKLKNNNKPGKHLGLNPYDLDVWC